MGNQPGLHLTVKESIKGVLRKPAGYGRNMGLQKPLQGENSPSMQTLWITRIEK